MIVDALCMDQRYRGQSQEMLLHFLKLNQNMSSSIVLKKIKEKFSFSEEIYQRVQKILYNETLPQKISLLPFAKTLLKSLKKDFQLFLITFGNERLQRMKLKSTGIDKGYFCKIIVTDQRVKKQSYQALFEEFQLKPKDGIVIGDRVLGDLKPAKELGCYAVHIKWGRGLNQEFDKSAMDQQVSHLSDFYQICREKIGKI